MVQYYRDMWIQQRKMLTQLSDLARECGQTKAAKAKETKTIPWQWDEKHQKAFNLVKATIVQDIVLTYPDNSEPFEIYML